MFAVGGNPVAARLSGIDVTTIKLLSFTVGRARRRHRRGDPHVAHHDRATRPGHDYVFAAFAAVVVGGTSIGGGRGAMWRTVLGVFFLAMITNGFNLLGINIYYQQVIKGMIILLAVAVDAMSTSRE